MYTLRKMATRTGTLGKPLPEPCGFATWTSAGVEFRRGGTSMIAGTPGSFKSVLALNLAASWASRDDLAVLFISADSDEFTVGKRMAGIMTGEGLSTVEANMSTDPHYYDRQLADLGDIEFSYDQMDAEGVKDYVEAFEVLYGAYPDVIFLDNLIDFASSPDDWAGMLLFIREMDAMARKTKAHVCILHHAKLREGSKKEGWPPADWEVTGKVTQLSRLVITVTNVDRWLYMSRVKNTNAQQDREARERYGFFVQESMRVVDSGHREVWAE